MMVTLWTITPKNSILLYPWIGTVLVVLSTTIDVQACVRAMYTLYNTWLNRTCAGASSFVGMPANWEANLLIIDGINYFPLLSATMPIYSGLLFPFAGSVLVCGRE